MKPALATAVLSAAVLLAGCAGARVGLNSSGGAAVPRGAPAAGTTYSSGTVRAEGTPNAYFGALFLGLVAAGMYGDFQDWNQAFPGRRPPELAEDRAIAERDCTQPMDTPSGNLRCK